MFLRGLNFNIYLSFKYQKPHKTKILFEYQKALIPTFHTNFLIQSTRTQIQKIRFKDFWYTKINQTQIWYDEFN